MTKEQLKELEDKLWDAADNLRANSDLSAAQYSTPVLGIIFLKFADSKYKKYEDEINRYNSESTINENYYNELIDFAEKLKEEDERHIKEGLSEDELELYDLHKKDKMTKEEEKRVKLAAKNLLHRLIAESPKVLVQDWYKDSQTQTIVKSAIKEVLDKQLPETYDRKIFISKRDDIFNLVYDYSIRGMKWAA